MTGGYVCLFLLVCAVVAGVILSKRSKRENNSPSGSQSPNIDEVFDAYRTPTLSIAAGFCELMMKKGLDRFLMRDYSSPLVLSHSDLKDKETAQRKLFDILLDIMRFLELPDLVRLNVECNNGNDEGSENAGHYNNSANGRIITVKIKPFYKHDNVLAILCHEVTHYFMEHNRLNWNDTELNENRTDVVANLIGFNRIMIAGYREIRNTVYSWDSRTIERHKIGYITESDCRDLGELLRNCRKIIRKKHEDEEQFSRMRQKTEQYLETAKTLSLHLSYIDPRNLKACTPERLREIQSVLMQKEVRDISGEILRIESSLRNISDVSKMSLLHQEVSKLCGDLSSWLAILNGN